MVSSCRMELFLTRTGGPLRRVTAMSQLWRELTRERGGLRLGNGFVDAVQAEIPAEQRQAIEQAGTVCHSRRRDPHGVDQITQIDPALGKPRVSVPLQRGGREIVPVLEPAPIR